MRIHSRAQVPVRPRTWAGQWLLAAILVQEAERQRLSRRLNKGKVGWNYDEPAVVEIACQLAVRRFFSESADVREITEFVRDLRSRLHDAPPPGQLETEALIRAALGDPDVMISDIDSGNTFNAYIAILGYICRKLVLSENDIRNLILESESMAFEQGWKPPLAD